MRNILILLAVIILVSYAVNDSHGEDSFLGRLQSGIGILMEEIDSGEFTEKIHDLFLSRENRSQKSTDENAGQMTLEPPEEHLFSVANIELGMTKNEVEALYGAPQRITRNEYNTDWHIYHQYYQNFFLVSYQEDGRVSALFTNQDLIASENGIRYGTPKETVLAAMGEPLTAIQKGFVQYKLPEDREFDIFYQYGNYITVFYDQLENETVTAILIVSDKLEKEKPGIYQNADETLREGFEYTLFDLTNAERVKHGLNPLKWDDNVRSTAREHSEDMAQNGFFSHTNLRGQSPFDRMKEDRILFTFAGENLAYGQFSSIYAHEGLFNSPGHRKNILEKRYVYAGVGVAFNKNHEPFFTQKFYAR